VSGFLKKADAEAALGPEATKILKTGALLDVAVRSAADRRMVAVTVAGDAVAGGVLKEDAVTDLGEKQSESTLMRINFTNLKSSRLLEAAWSGTATGDGAAGGVLKVDAATDRYGLE